MTWTPEPRSFATWNVERIGAQRRITQDGRLRVTEQGNIRIIERFPFSWVKEPSPTNPWVRE